MVALCVCAVRARADSACGRRLFPRWFRIEAIDRDSQTQELSSAGFLTSCVHTPFQPVLVDNLGGVESQPQFQTTLCFCILPVSNTHCAGAPPPASWRYC